MLKYTTELTWRLESYEYLDEITDTTTLYKYQILWNLLEKLVQQNIYIMFVEMHSAIAFIY